jgi:hypothetical protein
MPIAKRLTVVAVIFVAGMAALGCGSPTANAKPKVTTPSTTVPATTTTPSVPPTSTTTTIPAPQQNGQCMASQLQPSWPGDGNGASGHLYYSVNLLNSSAVTCVTGGYVGVSAYDPMGHLIAASAMRQGTGLSGPSTLSVAPGTSVYFTVGLPDVNQSDGGTSCAVTVGALHLIPPNETSEVQIATPISSGYPSLCGSTFIVSALQSGTGA